MHAEIHFDTENVDPSLYPTFQVPANLNPFKVPLCIPRDDQILMKFKLELED